jgi:DNA-binding FrmR family transcriptional regulator
MNKTVPKRYCHPEKNNRKSHHSQKLKSNLISRLNRIEGQIRGVKRMVDTDVYCDDILNVLSSIQAALSGVSTQLLEYHMKSCIVQQLQEGDLTVIDELMKTTRKMMK